MKKQRWIGFSGILAMAAVAWGLQIYGQSSPQQKPVVGYDDTPMLPGGKWRVHDGNRPQPRAVTPGASSLPVAPGKPPSDAIVLFDGADLSKWRTVKGDLAGWKVENGYVEVVPRAGNILTREEFGDCQLHIEWRTPSPPSGASQARGNSGVFFLGRYEIQVLDSFETITYPDGLAAALYGQYPPLVNASRPPGEWQTYDILFTIPRFKEGKLQTPAYATVLHNGVVVHNHTALLGPTKHRTLPEYVEHGPGGPLMLQDHGDKVRFRNIWVRPLKGYDQP